MASTQHQGRFRRLRGIAVVAAVSCVGCSAWHRRLGEPRASVAAESIDVGPTGAVTAVFALVGDVQQIVAVRYGAGGRVLWSTALRPSACPNLDFAPEVRATADGGAIVVAAAGFYAKGRGPSLCIVRLDREGGVGWAHVLDEGGPLARLAVAPSGVVVVAAASGQTGESFVASWGDDGAAQWRTNWPGEVVDLGVGADSSIVALLRSSADLDPATPEQESLLLLGLAPDGRTRWRRFIVDEFSGAPHHRVELAVDASGNAYLGVRSRGGVQLTKYSPRGEPSWLRTIDASAGIRLRAGEERVAIAVEQPLGWQISTLSADGARGGSAEISGSGVEALGVASDAIFVAGWFSARADFGPAGRARSRCEVREEWPQGDPHVPRDVKLCAQEGYVARIPLQRLTGDGSRRTGSRCVSPGGGPLGRRRCGAGELRALRRARQSAVP